MRHWITHRVGERTRLKLLATRAGLLARTSHRDLGAAAICRAAGQAKGTFYVYFESKDAFSSSSFEGT